MEENKTTIVSITVKSGITFGSALAMVISYTTWKSVERACERTSSPRYLTRGGTKNKRQYTLLSGKRCFYKAKLLLTGC